MRSSFYPKYDFITNFNKEALAHILICVRLSGLNEYSIDERAYDRRGELLPNMSALVAKNVRSQEFELHKFFRYHEELTQRLIDIYKRNGLLPQDYSLWMQEYDLYLGCEDKLFPKDKIKYTERGAEK